jgi:hypothetical protein
MGVEDIQFRRFEDEDGSAWEAFVDQCDGAWLQHRGGFIRSVPYEHSFSMIIDGRISGVCVLGRERRRRGAYLTGPGLALLPSARSESVYRAVRGRLRAIARIACCEAVEFSLPPMAPANRRADIADTVVRSCGFSDHIRWRWAWEPLLAYHSVLDLRLELEEILRGFSKGNKASVKRCAKSGLRSTIRTGPEVTESHWDDFVRIHRMTYARSGGTPFSESRLRHLFGLTRQGKMALSSGFRNEECVTALLVAIDKGGAFYLAGGATDEARQQGAMAWAQYESIGWLKDNSFEHYCLGFTVPALSRSGAGGISDSKKRFGGEQWLMLAGDLVLRPLSFVGRQCGPDLVTRFVRRLARQGGSEQESP